MCEGHACEEINVRNKLVRCISLREKFEGHIPTRRHVRDTCAKDIYTQGSFLQSHACDSHTREAHVCEAYICEEVCSWARGG